MYDILQLNDMLVPELRDVAEQLGVKGHKKLNKQELIYKILDEQALNKKPENGQNKTEAKEEPEFKFDIETQKPKKESPKSGRKKSERSAEKPTERSGERSSERNADKGDRDREPIIDQILHEIIEIDGIESQEKTKTPEM